MKNICPAISLSLEDTQWPLTYTDHQRTVVRAIVFDDSGRLYFMRADRDDIFGKGIFIETAGGGVEPGEDRLTAVHRELREELGVQVEVLGELGTVSDYYNLIHRHNQNHYYLCRVTGFVGQQLTRDEVERFHLSVQTLTYEQAVEEYQRRACQPLGRLIADRELPILHHAQAVLDRLKQA